MRRKQVIYADPYFFPGLRVQRSPRTAERLRVWGPLLAISAAVVAGAFLGKSRAPNIPIATMQVVAPAVLAQPAPEVRPLVRVQSEPVVIQVTMPARK
jgi:hypothetical protein